MKRLELSGLKFNRLKVLNFIKMENSESIFLCLCDCGNLKEISGRSLKSGNTQSCGCYRKEQNKIGIINSANKNRKEYGEASFNSLLYNYKKRAKLKNIEFSLSKDEFKILTKQNCYYCSEPPKQIRIDKKCNGEYIYNGVDRVDNTKGYEIYNCVACCKKCNFNKKDTSIEIALKMVEFFNRKVNKYGSSN